MEEKIFTYGRYEYTYCFIIQERKSISLTVQPSLRIIVKCPPTYTQERVDIFLKKKWKWLEKQLRYFRLFQKKNREKEYVSGESFLYLGRQYRLQITEGEKDQLTFQHGTLLLTRLGNIAEFARNKEVIESWYQERALKILKDRYKRVQKLFLYEDFPELGLRKMEKRWGSFLGKKKILLNPELIKVSTECIDYVIAHELCHMKYKNHDRKFFDHLESKIPKWEDIKEKLEMRLFL